MDRIFYRYSGFNTIFEEESMKLKEVARPILSLMFGVAIIVLTARGLVPVEAFVAVATASIIWWFKSRDEEKLRK